ncbi:fungal-specific transcription factor domain-containing protein [Boeremia exigua]|uniref:fungal-specific transcription factor domain-containing protein n=1 Tax=Boeremia exigua TaxID=749465 RepID=UPI001E8E1CA9|nr:fungal-specific transcription factor domain-containing protein [Boeremia exigua]KAH6612121.1 fungal-specific transcription factor domain-containing protein [Boeremia exigua]
MAQVLQMQAAPELAKPQFDPTMDAATDREPPTPASPDSGEGRGRRREREDSGDDGADGELGGSRKRRRSRKGLDKKFECPHGDCGKSYSRAEHLYRHQLNHNPKQIYNCDFPDCHRSFVRQDLCARHKERHTARGSQLLRKDTFNMHNLNPIVTAALGTKSTPGVKPLGAKGQSQLQSPPSAVSSVATGSHMSPPFHSPAPARQDSLNRIGSVGSEDAYRSGPDTKPYDMQAQGSGNFAPPPRPAALSNYSGGRNSIHSSPHVGNSYQRPELRASTSNMSSYSTTGSSYSASVTPTQSYTPTAASTSYQNSSSGFQSQQNFPAFSSLPPPEYPQPTGTPATQGPDTQYYNGTSGQTPMNGVEPTTQLVNGVTDAMMDQTPSYAIPMFGGEGYSRSPFAMADDFAAWLFNDNQTISGSGSPMAYQGGVVPTGGTQSSIGPLQAPYFNYDPGVAGYMQHQPPPANPMAVHAMLDTSLPEIALSEEKRRDLIDLIIGRFNETDHAPVKKQKEDILEGNKDDDHHVLSLHMMQTYISSYWRHFHPQLPILHKPTFNASTCPDLLLLAIMCLGASCLEKTYGHETTSACASLANFMAWHLRWEMFMDADFRPPAKLWIFQGLLLLESFEKMYSTRPLHERAHIHHATTLTLMRRGSSLIGRSAMDSPPSNKDGRSSSQGGIDTPEEWWKHWITNEATRRAAFAAFLMDSIHATMFGHSAVMVAHEMRLPLPCDEALWSATSSSEVGRVEASLHSNGVKPTSFLDGLKKTLNGQTVRTNSFGRTILMAGLLSVSWHMNQRDLQVSSLGVTQALGGRDKWRGSLTRAFDFWKQDFDSSLARPSDLAAPNAYAYSNGLDDENVFEARTVLHHLAHMAMHVDIVDCQIYAGAPRLLGRSITHQDYNGAQRRMKDVWAPTARARDATFYALRFLSNVLVSGHHSLTASAGTSVAYTARDDVLLNRPWVLYFATLIVWSYGFALDGPIQQPYSQRTYDEKVRDMTGYLKRVGGVRAPDDLAKLADRNACLGLLLVMRDMFKKTRWELLHEASTLLTKCVEMLVPGAGAL